MKLKTICNNVAAKVLGVPGTVIECMDGSGVAVRNGNAYTVDFVKVASGGRNHGEPLLTLLGRFTGGYLPTRFRKVQ